MVREKHRDGRRMGRTCLSYGRARKGPGTTDLQKHALGDLLPSARLQFLKFPPLSETASPETECLTCELVGSFSIQTVTHVCQVSPLRLLFISLSLVLNVELL